MKYKSLLLKSIIFASLLTLVIFVFKADLVFAQTAPPADTFGLTDFEQETNLGTTDVRRTVARVINVFLSFLGVLAVGIVLYGGFIYMTAAGDDEKVTRAKKILINGVIGLVIILSAWSITRFIISRLSTATGTGSVEILTQCQQLRIANDPNFATLCGDVSGGISSCITNPRLCCAARNFVVQSITPRTDATNINNTTVRAVFSRTVAGVADSLLTVTQGGVNITSQFTFSFADAPANRIVEGVFNGASSCPGGAQCVAAGDYQISVNEGVVDTSGGSLVSTTSCGDFPTNSVFTVNTPDVVDVDIPTSPAGILINNSRQVDQTVPRGRALNLSLDSIDNAGISYVRIRVAREDGSDSYEIYEAPAISRGSDATTANPYTTLNSIFIAANTPGLTRFLVTASVVDIDGNTNALNSSFVVVGQSCANGIQDGDETGVDTGGSCPGTGACTAGWQCVSGSCGQNGQCLSTPIITSVDRFDGAAGNWITIQGRFFGTAPGVVEFGDDGTADGNFILAEANWQTAGLAQCVGGLSPWQDSYVIVRVPDDVALPVGSESSIRITRADDTSLEDTTTNNRGIVGLFQKNTTQRPGICQVVTAGGASAATPNSDVFVQGSGFGDAQGTSQVQWFRTIQSSVTNWGPNQINTRVPDNNLQPGRVDVTVTVNGETSNGVPFTILSQSDAIRPSITAISPGVITAGSYITLNGQRFGGIVGNVYLSADATNQCDPVVNPALPGCIPLIVSLPTYCGTTWRDDQIVAQVSVSGATAQASASGGTPPQVIDPAVYYLTVRTALGVISQNQSAFPLTVATGGARPSICSLTPNSGPAPLPVGQSLQISGVNFSNTPTIYFWSQFADATDTSTWLSASGGAVQPVVAGSINTQVTTGIPTVTNPIRGFYTMASGPVVLANAAGELSNAVQYTVSDCRNLPGTPAGFQCCTEGADVGLLRPDTFICAGQTRDAGYVWRFTTGRIPNIPYVVESCNPASLTSLPSPSPWSEWQRQFNTGRQACLNSEIRVQFSTSMDSASVLANSRIYTCGTGAQADCNNRVDVTNQFQATYEGTSLRAIPLGPNSNLTTNTWYRVELTEGVRSEENQVILGRNVPVNEALRVTRPCGQSLSGQPTAYCFEFQAGGEQCSLVSAAIDPSAYTTNFLGVVQDNRQPFDVDNPLNPAFPLFYQLWGRGEQSCSVIRVDGRGWNWATNNLQTATAQVSPGNGRTDTRAIATAVQDSMRGSVQISATEPGGIRGLSDLTINLADPAVEDYWPKGCTESCVNLIIGARFNRQMLVATYPQGFSLRACSEPTCTNLGQTIPFTIVQSDARTLRVTPNNNLQPGSWYLATFNENIRALSRLGSAVPGNSLAVFSFKFRTKTVDPVCLASTVNVVPDPFRATSIGQKTLYSAIPYGAPDQCSRFGQELNPYGYGWNWSVANQNVATISNFSSIALAKPACTFGCTPDGSDIARGTTLTGAVCGDGVVEVNNGEDCDIGVVGEVPGVSCSLNCLRPGNRNVGTGAGQCGNSTVEVLSGEECDPGSQAFCLADCTLPGTPPIGDAPNVSQCGDGAVQAEEDCEGTSQNCSNRCLHTGSLLLSQNYCTTQAATPLGTTTIGRSIECRSASSICGNGVVEFGEECEIQGNIETSQTIALAGLQAVPTPGVELATTYCTNRCVLRDICSFSALPNTLRCDGGAVGCNSDCTLAGSSPLYSTPSLCGDGVVGIGEFGACEYATGEFDPAVILGQDPIQVVSAVGNAQGGANGLQSTTVAAATTQVRLAPGQTRNIQISGTGNYSLQCGYIEFAESTPVAGTTLSTFNTCPGNIAAAGAGNASGLNTDGVGSNSCCYARATRQSEYPVDGAGISGANGLVCLNTALRVTLNGEIDESTVKGNIDVVRGETGTTCRFAGEIDVTAKVGLTLVAYLDGDGSEVPVRFWGKLWYKVKSFFAKSVGETVYASRFNASSVQRWCVGATEPKIALIYQVPPAVTATTTVISASITELLAEDSIYAVLLNGGASGIKDNRGVGIGPAIGSRDPFNDSYIFRTGTEVCKINSISVAPQSHLFTVPQTSQQFVATINSTNNQQIVPIPNVYNWTYSWGPQNHAVFNIPQPGSPTDQATTNISVNNLEGQVDGYINAAVVTDITTQNNHTGRTFTGKAKLAARFCQNPWPSRRFFPYEEGIAFGNTVNQSGYVNGAFDGSALVPVNLGGRPEYFNFSMSYCADGGVGSTDTDDLPRLEPVVFIDTRNLPQGTRLADDTLKRFLFFNEKNNDAIGIQIFQNSDPADPLSHRLSAKDWYKKRFGEPVGFSEIEIDSYKGITDGNNIYIDALNVPSAGDDVYNNIYLFSINADAQAGTREVFAQLIKSLKFNINVSDFGFCSIGNGTGPGADNHINQPETTPSIVCETDFDCQDVGGDRRICANARTKMLRDWTRLYHIRDAQAALASFSASNQAGLYPDLNAGSYIPGQTNSRWPSWGRLRSQIGTLAVDPINEWLRCGSNDIQTCWDPTLAQYQCPEIASVYEYEATRGVGSVVGESYLFHASLEYFTVANTVVREFVDLSKFTTARACAPTSVSSPFGSTCGDGIINIGATEQEQCDPPGRALTQGPGISCPTVLGPNGNQVQQIAGGVCSNSCQITASCTNPWICGNGVIELGEACDDGGINGQFGQCNTQCSGGAAGLACGDGNLPGDVNNNSIRDPGETGVEFCEVSGNRWQIGFCQKTSCRDGRFIFNSLNQNQQGKISFIDARRGWEVVNQVVGGTRRQTVRATIDGGSNWTDIYTYTGPRFLRDIFFVDENNGFISLGGNTSNLLGRDGGMLITGDGGRSWVEVGFGGMVGIGNFIEVEELSIQFINPRVGWSWSPTSIWKTTDGARNWAEQINTTVPLLSGNSIRGLFFLNSNIGWLVGNNGMIHKSIDGGSGWSARVASGTNNPLNDVFFVDANIGWAVGNNNTILKSVNGGDAWVRQTITYPVVNNGSLTKVKFVDQNIGWAVGGTSFYFTIDGGANWRGQAIAGSSVVDAEFININSGFIVVSGFGQTRGLVGIAADPYCATNTDCTTNASCSNNDLCVAANDATYHASQGQSCNWDCQAYGGFCGDGVLHGNYEECDDGNRVDSDTCTNLCFTRTVTNTVVGPGNTDCGNNRIDAGELCDLGSNNGIPCSPTQYGQSCTYCSASCEAVLTVDAIGACGNGEIDQTGTDSQGRAIYEICDTRLNGSVVSASIVNNSIQLQGNDVVEVTRVCTDKGVFTCVAQCTRLESTCTTCNVVEVCPPLNNENICTNGLDDDNDGLIDRADQLAGGANPRYAILNPMTGETYRNTFTTTGWGNVNGADFLAPNFRLTPTGTFPDPAQKWIGARSPVAPQAFADYQAFITAIFDRGRAQNTVKINTNLLCADSYYLDFSSQAYFGWRDNRRSQEATRLAQFPRKTAVGDFFPFKVNGEQTIVTNEFVVSPPVQPSAIRVVVRATDQENTQGALFVGNVYNEAFPGTTQEGRIVNFASAQSTASGSCGSIQQTRLTTGGFLYWFPSGCGNGLPGTDGGVYFHPYMNLPKTYIQATTIVMGAGSVRTAPANVNNSYAFFVSNASVPIGLFRNSNLVVDIYTYHQGQEANTSPGGLILGNFLPTQTFEIRRADLSTNVNSSGASVAQYWHVFNLVKTGSSYQVQTLGATNHGQIQSDFTEVQCDIPGHTCPRSGSGQSSAQVQEPACVAADWQCGNWDPASPACNDAGQRTRTCTVPNQNRCSNPLPVRPSLIETCVCGPENRNLCTQQNCVAEGGGDWVGGQCVVLPDLLMGNIVGPVRGVQGGVYAFTADVCNRGAAASVASTLRIRFIQPGGASTATSREVGILPPNTCQSVPVNLEATQNLGNVRLEFWPDQPGLVTDQSGLVTESNEGNNISEVFINITPAPNLRVEVINGPTTGGVNQALQYTASVCNRGASDSPPGVVARVSFTLPNGSSEFTDVTIPAAIPVGWCTSTAPATVTPTTAGSLVVGVTADPGNLIPESNENDNQNPGSFRALISVGPDLVVQSIRLNGPGSFVATICNIGQGTVTTDFSLFFVSRNPSISDAIDFTNDLTSAGTTGACGDITNGGFGSSTGVTVTVDNTNLVAEANENNNVGTL